MFLKVRDVQKSFLGKNVLRDINFNLEEGELLSFIGPSGSGKTTLLKLLANLDLPDSGSIEYTDKPTKENPVLLVFQDYLLFPHLSIFENVAFGLRSRRWGKEQLNKLVREYLDYFSISEKAQMYPNQLSAGQQQRAAIARAMVVKPSLLLLDEPFANLDKNLKMETADFIKKMQKDLGTTTISVTHDLQEAFAMSDRIGLLMGGKIRQIDTTDKVYFQPDNLEVAQFLGPVNRIPKELFSALGILSKEEVVYSRAEAVELTLDPSGIGVIRDVCFTGLAILIEVQIGKHNFKIYSLNSVFKAGDRVSLSIKNYFKD